MSAFRILILMVTGCCSLVATPAWPAACRITTTTLSFGFYDVITAADKTAGAQITVNCTDKTTTPAFVQLSLSAGNSGSFSQRTLLVGGGGTPLNYNVRTASGSTAPILGDGSGGSIVLNAQVDKSAPWVVTLYGRIPAQQVVPMGSYSDSLIATILY